MNEILEQLVTLLGVVFTWDEQPSTYTVHYKTEESLISKIWIAEQWINETPLECVSVAMNSESVTLIFEKPKEKEEGGSMKKKKDKKPPKPKC